MNIDPETESNSPDTPEDFNLDEAVASISSDLFGQDEDGDGKAAEVEKSEVPQEGTPDEASTSVETPPAEENSAEVQAVGAPSSWTKEAIAEWAKTPPRVQQEILKREEDMFRGLQQYKERAEVGEKYTKVVEPYAPMLAAEQIDPVQLFQAFAGNHYLLARGTADQKLDIATNLITHYGIDPVALVERLGSQTQVPPEVRELKQYVQTLEGRINSREQQEAEARKATAAQEVQAFAADPANVYFQDVASDMTMLLKADPGLSLKDAYDRAVWANPLTRDKELTRSTAARLESQRAAEQAKAEEARKRQAANVNASSKTRDGTVPVGSMDDTLNETLARIQSRG